MRCLSVRQPWAGLIASGVKTIELRTWRTHYRGDLLICASGRPSRSGDAAAARTIFGVRCGAEVCGVALCIVRLVGCREANPESRYDLRAACCRPNPGEFAWVLVFVRRVEPIPVKGRMSLFNAELGG